jgi:hypothetical protein
VACALAIQLLLERQLSRCTRIHRRDIAACAKSAFCAGHHDATDRRIDSKPFECGDRLLDHLARQCVQPLGSIEGHDGDAVFNVDEEVVGWGHG